MRLLHVGRRDRNLKTLEDQLNAQNLTYGGYRISQEQQAAQDYQNALAQAAAQVNSNIGQIQSGLASTLNQNALQRASAMYQAEHDDAASAATTGTDPGAGDGGGAAGGDGSQYSTTGVGLSAAQTAAAEQAARRLALAAQGYWTAGL